MVGEILSQRRAILRSKAEPNEPEPPKPDLAFEPIKANGSFSMLFDSTLVGLDFISELGVEVKANGQISELFADDAIDPSEDISDSLNIGRR